MNMNAMILCGGLSTRLGDITKSIPKILLEIGDRTVLDWQLGALTAAGFDTVTLAAGHLAETLKRVVGDEHLGMNLSYVIEDKKLGTGGAIKNALGLVPQPREPTLILNGDILTITAYADIIAALRPKSDGIILGSLVDDASSYGTLNFRSDDGLLLSFEEKRGIVESAHINGGIYLFTPHIHQYFPKKEIFSIEYDVFPHVKNLDVFPSRHPWIDVGVPERLAWARENWQLFIMK